MKKIEVCFTPALLHLYDIRESIVVVIDIFRATSSICYGIDNGAEAIIPVATVEACQGYCDRGYLLAAERNGEVVEGFDFGNSPFAYTSQKVSGKTVVLTTTNGTHAIRLSMGADQVVAGAFLNLHAIADFVEAAQKDVLVVCAGWKGNFNLEDTLFAGGLASRLEGKFTFANDAALAAMHLYRLAQADMQGFLSESSHVQRLKNLDIIKDIAFCLQEDLYQVVPVLQGDCLVANQGVEKI